jgi:hypothetical protein
MIQKTSIVYSWFVKRHSLIFIISVLFLLTIGTTFFIGYQQNKESKDHILRSDRTSANLLSDLITEHEKAALNILQSYALRPLFVDAVEKRDFIGVTRHIIKLKENNSEIDMVFVTDNVETCLKLFRENRFQFE